MTKNTTEIEIKLLSYLDNKIKECGYPPSLREICKEMGFKSTSTAHSYIEKLERDGYIKKDPIKPRALKILYENIPSTSGISNVENIEKELISVPLLGKVAAGQPILAVENIEDTFPLPSDFVQKSNVFMLRVHGDSMIEAGILNKDLIIVNQQSTALNGEIVVALIGDETTVKTFYKEDDHIRLQPENKFLSPIIVKDNFSILGKVIGVIRKL